MVVTPGQYWGSWKGGAFRHLPWHQESFTSYLGGGFTNVHFIAILQIIHNNFTCFLND